jgi:predicted ArsR family transcriptional regulator
MDFQKILDQVGFSHNTLRLHLNNLMGRGLFVREKGASSGPGWPRFTYSTSGGLGSRVSSTQWGSSEMVSLPFRRFRY